MTEIDETSDVYGLIYSSFGELGPKPQSWVPQSITEDLVMEILLRSTCFISIDIAQMHDKIINFPFPEYNLQGITYFFKKTKDTPDRGETASFTLLINDKLAVFINQNIENIKENFRILSQNLNENKGIPTKLLLKHYYNLINLINGHKSLQIITSSSAESEEASLICVLLSYFHGKIGPMSFSCYPDILEPDQKHRISKELEFSISEGYFTRSYPDFIAVHHYFEIPSEFARGKMEMCLFSFIFNKIPSKDQISHLSFQFSQFLDKLVHKKGVALGFYEQGYRIHGQEQKIKEMSAFLRHWVKKVYDSLNRSK
ncbi:MAG: hypothetical protein ACTSRS_14645 [Candidatus Helarchaeota archaeon]